jgi:hypothetical protein
MTQPSDDIVSASEIGSWVWCPESWRLEASGAKPENRTQLDEGTRFHKQTASIETVTRSALWLGAFLLVAALVVLAAVILGVWR